MTDSKLEKLKAFDAKMNAKNAKEMEKPNFYSQYKHYIFCDYLGNVIDNDKYNYLYYISWSKDIFKDAKIKGHKVIFPIICPYETHNLKVALQKALGIKNADINNHFGDVCSTLAKMQVNLKEVSVSYSFDYHNYDISVLESVNTDVANGSDRGTAIANMLTDDDVVVSLH